MRAYEILCEDNYVDEIDSALTDLLSSAKAQGVDKISTLKLVQALADMGYNVNIDSIMDVLSGNPFVQSATKDVVDLKGQDDAGVSGDQAAADQNKEAVSQMAQSAVSKEL